MVTVMRSRDRARATRDAGYTLSELLVVITLLGLVLGAAYMFVYAIRVGQRQSDREATLARAVSVPLLSMERVIVQNSAIDPAASSDYQLSGYQLRVLTDQNTDNTLEQRTFSAVQDSAGNGYVDLQTYLVDSAGNRVGAAMQNGHIGYDNTNLRDGVPLFRYFDGATEIFATDGAVSAHATSVLITLRVTVDGRSENHTDIVTFRNR